MGLVNQVIGDLYVTGTITAQGGYSPAHARSTLEQDNNKVYPIPLNMLRVWDAAQTNLPGTAATDDLELNTGTLGTHSWSIQTGDLKNAGSTTRYARCSIPLPPEYVAGETVTIRAKAGMKTTIASTAATIDFEVYRVARDGTVGSDICATSATTINSTTLADKDFTVTASSLSPGDMLDVRMAILVNDTGTGTAVIGWVGALELVCDVKG